MLLLLVKKQKNILRPNSAVQHVPRILQQFGLCPILKYVLLIFHAKSFQ